MMTALTVVLGAFLGLVFAGSAEWLVTRSEVPRMTWLIRSGMLLLCIVVIVIVAVLMNGAPR
jgi:hypothetical protein